MNERTVFLTALEIEDSVRRKAYLDETCAREPALRERVEALLRSHQREGAFLDIPVVEQLGSAGRTQERVPLCPENDQAIGFLSPSD